jgi:hypothetical protein
MSLGLSPSKNQFVPQNQKTAAASTPASHSRQKADRFVSQNPGSAADNLQALKLAA